MNKKILGLAIPNIITNITVPLLGMVDMAIVGHLSAAHIGAITIGSSIFNLVYWNFGFLRMGTSGFAAQAYGAHNLDEAVRVFVRSIAVAWGIALLLLVLQWPISKLALLVFNGSDDVLAMALTYFFVRIWAAPATLGLYAVKGWFIGMQNSRLPMWIAISLNIVNIVCSLIFVLVLHWDIAGVALGTVIAQYSGLAIGLFFLGKRYGKLFRRFLQHQELAQSIHSRIDAIRSLLKQSLRWSELKHYFRVNGDIFIRTFCLAIVFAFVTSESGKISDEILAVDALILQFATLFSYIMDGFAFAGESLVGRYVGAKDRKNLKLSVRLIMLWGIALTLVFVGLYAVGSEFILRIFSDEDSIIETAMKFQWAILLLPICGFAAYLYDGIFVGATASKTMRNTMLISSITFFGVYFGLRAVIGGIDTWTTNSFLLSAFLVYLLMRGLLMGVKVNKSIYSLAE